jgi:uncharacterized protein (TIGR00106 family)
MNGVEWGMFHGGGSMTLVEVSITPIGKGESVSKWVAQAVDLIDRSGLRYQLGPMGTCIEGEWDDIVRVIGECIRTLQKDCNRISVSLKADVRKGSESRLEQKVRSVEKKLGRAIKKG